MSEARARRVLWGLGVGSLLIQLPFLERGISLHDEGSMLAIGEALANGEVLYRDRVTSLPPLTFELMGGLFRVFGPNLVVGRILQMLVFSGVVLLVHALLRRSAGSRTALLGGLAVLAIKPLGFRLWTIVNYSQLAILLCLAAVLLMFRFLESRRDAWLVAAGAAVGLAVLTKQNLGGLLACLVVGGIVGSWCGEAGRTRGELIRRLARLAGAMLTPMVCAVVYYTARGGGGELLDQTLWRALGQRASYWVPLPAAWLWSLRPEGAGHEAFTYFPAPLFNLSWQGRVPLFSGTLGLIVELFVKSAYYVPPLLLVVAAISLTRHSSPRDRLGWSARWIALLLGAAMYAGTLHRADWTHLMNVYPALIVLSATALAWLARASRPWNLCGAGLLAIWLAGGTACYAAVLMAYRTPVSTPRGRLIGTPERAAEAARVLAYLRERPAREKIVILRGEPLYYFLTGRRILLRHDVFLPGLVRETDDGWTAARLREVDVVLYNPRESPLIPLTLPEYAPASAAVLAREFRIVRTLGEAALVLRPLDKRVPRGLEREDLWGATSQRHRSDAEPLRTHWAMYRVLTAPSSDPGGAACWSFERAVEVGDRLVVLPLLHPRLWGSGPQPPPSVRFTIEVDGRLVHETRRSAGPPGDGVEVPLGDSRGRRVHVRLCTEAPAPLAERDAGWAEPRIVTVLSRSVDSPRVRLRE